MRRQHRHAGRHGGVVRGHRSRVGDDLDDDQLAGVDPLRDVPRGGRAAGRAVESPVGDDPERHPEGVHRAEGVHLPAAPLHAADRRYLPLLRRTCAALEHDLGERLPHPRSRGDRRPGTRVHVARRHRVRPVGRRRRARRRHVRAAPLVLLQRPQRFLRGNRQVPGRAPHLGAGDAGALRRPIREGLAAALPHPDGGCVADRPAALQQRRPDDAAGARRGAWRHQLAAHQLAGRSAGPADQARPRRWPCARSRSSRTRAA